MKYDVNALSDDEELIRNTPTKDSPTKNKLFGEI